MVRDFWLVPVQIHLPVPSHLLKNMDGHFSPKKSCTRCFCRSVGELSVVRRHPGCECHRCTFHRLRSTSGAMPTHTVRGATPSKIPAISRRSTCCLRVKRAVCDEVPADSTRCANSRRGPFFKFLTHPLIQHLWAEGHRQAVGVLVEGASLALYCPFCSKLQLEAAVPASHSAACLHMHLHL